jgi:hypothetical protein
MSDLDYKIFNEKIKIRKNQDFRAYIYTIIIRVIIFMNNWYIQNILDKEILLILLLIIVFNLNEKFI